MVRVKFKFQTKHGSWYPLFMIAWSRKYRPAKVEELDQDRVREFFRKALVSGRLSQAYLFTGPKGTGKTSTARILAAVLNCEKNQEKVVAQKGDLSEPCMKCDNCREIVGGGSNCLIEIDAASNRGIDDIRALRERIGLMSGGVVRTTYIIDEVHMLTKEAFNALLKTLEEPPEHVVFCLCTTEEHKLLPTIVSRCTKVEFGLAKKEEVKRSLTRVIEGEGIEIDDEALEEIARNCEGSFRDAVKHLERLAADSSKITLERVNSELGIADKVVVEELLGFMLVGNVVDAMRLVEDLTRQGQDGELVMKKLVEIAQERISDGLSKGGVDKKLLSLIQVVSKGFARYADVPIPSLPLEMAVVEYCLMVKPDLAVVETGAKKEFSSVERVEKRVKKKPEKVVAKKAEKKHVEEGDADKKAEAVEKGAEERESELDQDGDTEAEGVDLELTDLKARWSQVLDLVSRENHGLLTLVNRVSLVGVAGRHLQLQVGYKFHKEQLEQYRYLSILEKALEQVYGVKIRCDVEVNKKGRVTPKMSQHENVTGVIEKQDQELIASVEEAFGI